MSARAKEIPLTRGFVALVDAGDFEWLNQWKWSAVVTPHVTRDGRTQVYAHRGVRSGGRNTVIRMHRQIMGAAPGQIVDHENGWGLDCWRRNLRFASPSQSAANRGALPSKLNLIGVQPNRSGRGFWVSIRHENRRIFRGGFATSVEAALAYDRLARQLRGQFAVTNFPEAQHD